MKFRANWGMAAAAGCMAVAAMAGRAEAAPMTAAQALSQFNAIVLGDFTSNSDVEGRLVVGGNLTGGATFYNNPRGAASPYAAINVAGNSTGSGPYNVNNGGSVVIGGTNASRFNLNGGGTLSTGTPNISATAVKAPLTALAAQIAAMAANSMVDAHDPNNVAFNAVAGANGVAVFSITTADIAGYRNININFGNASTIYVNVIGASLTDTANFNANAYVNQHVIWNFVDATSLNFGFWHGTVLAPNAAVTNATPIEGVLVANSFNGRGELHDYAFTGYLPDPVRVPEPATLGLLALGLGTVGLMRYRRAEARA